MSRRYVFRAKILNDHKVSGLEVFETQWIRSVNIFIQPCFPEKSVIRVRNTFLTLKISGKIELEGFPTW